MTRIETARADVAYLAGYLNGVLASAYTMTPAARRSYAAGPFNAPPGSDGAAGLGALQAALRIGTDDALGDASYAINAQASAASDAAQGPAELEVKTWLQSLAGSGAGAAVIQGGAFAAGVQNRLGDPLGAAAAINAEIAKGNDSGNLAGAALKKGEEFASLGFGLAVALAALAAVGAYFYLRGR